MIDVSKINTRNSKYFQSVSYLYHTINDDDRNKLFEYLINTNIKLAAKCVTSYEYNAAHENIILSKVKKLLSTTHEDDVATALRVLTDIGNIEPIISSYNIGNKHYKWVVIREMKQLFSELDRETICEILKNSHNNAWLSKLIIEYIETHGNPSEVIDNLTAKSMVINLYESNKELALRLCFASEISCNDLPVKIINSIAVIIDSYINNRKYIEAARLSNTTKINPQCLSSDIDEAINAILSKSEINSIEFELIKNLFEYCKLYNKVKLVKQIDALLTYFMPIEKELKRFEKSESFANRNSDIKPPIFSADYISYLEEREALQEQILVYCKSAKTENKILSQYTHVSPQLLNEVIQVLINDNLLVLLDRESGRLFININNARDQFKHASPIVRRRRKTVLQK